MVAAGLPDFGPVQANVSFNDAVGTTRGIHAEPWDKFISIANGSAFCAWVDLREGPTFGTVFTAILDPSKAAFVPSGVGNSFQTLQPNTSYVYLVNDHYNPGETYTCVNLADETLSIHWPVPLRNANLSANDRRHPRLRNVAAIPPKKILVLGASGQLGTALREHYARASDIEFADRSDIDLRADNLESLREWRNYSTVINCAAYTAVDDAETTEGCREAWAVNVRGVAALTQIATKYRLTVVHVSSDYVFDGSSSNPYREDALPSPLNVYGQTKAAADQIVASTPRHYIVRTSWVIGAGRNFVRTMATLAQRGVDPRVVNDQRGRLTFASELAAAIDHLVSETAPYGTYNVTGGGPVRSWAEIARRVFDLAGKDPSRVTGVSTSEYNKTAATAGAKRPSNSALDLTKIESTGFRPASNDDALSEYIQSIASQIA